MGDDTIFENYQRYDFYQLLWFTKADGDNIYFLDFNEYKIKEDQIVLIFPGQIDNWMWKAKKATCSLYIMISFII